MTQQDQPLGQQPSLEDQYLGVRDSLLKLNEVKKDGNDKQVAYWCGTFTRRAAEYVRNCLGDMAPQEPKIVIAQQGEIPS